MENILKIDKIEKYYGNKSSLTKAIDNLSFDVEKGEFVDGVALGFHQPNSFPASSFAGMRAAMTSRIRPCS